MKVTPRCGNTRLQCKQWVLGRDGMIRENWNEAELVAIPHEHDSYERKRGALLDNNDEFQKELAVQLSAMANSGGGHVILGQQDDGAFDGVANMRGRTPTRQWIEQIVPNLTQFPLPRFRVHEIAVSTLPVDRPVIVIDIPDSHLAPHQAYKGTLRQYYVRAGGHAVPAPHHFLEALRNRLTKIVLVPQLEQIVVNNAYEHHAGYAVVDFVCRWSAKNQSRQSASLWTIETQFPPNEWISVLTHEDFPRIPTEKGVVRRRPILPGRAGKSLTHFGIAVDPQQFPSRQLLALFEHSQVVGRAISENHIGEDMAFPMNDYCGRDIIDRVENVLRRNNFIRPIRGE
jgi:hypothetical protein